MLRGPAAPFLVSGRAGDAATDITERNEILNSTGQPTADAELQQNAPEALIRAGANWLVLVRTR